LAEVEDILSLVTELATRAGSETKPRRKLTSGTWNVEAADEGGVTLESKSRGSAVHTWADLPAADVLALLTPTRSTPEQSHAVALLAANLGERGAFVGALLPLFENSAADKRTNALVARHLYGLSVVPEGGYAAYKGEILDAQGVSRRQTQERVAFLGTEADRLLDLVEKDPAFRKLAKLQSMRDDLDDKRKYALRAIFNTTHYPYPADKDARYWAVQGEIDRRVKVARDIWDDPYVVSIERDGKLAKSLDAWDAVLLELEIKAIDTAELRKRMEPFARYATGERLTIRTYYRNDMEKELLAYNRWVMGEYNPARTEEARPPEMRQVEVTNEYRMLIGFTANVTPGSAPYASITKDNVVQILDQATLDSTMPLRAVRIDNRLTRAARLHSEDMSKRGYFAHQAPPDPGQGRGATGPADRMQREGYQGFGYSENIAMSGSPDTAHQMWIHSSGHHRNILSGWIDLGSGLGGRNFTQNFGTGGGGGPEIQPDTGVRDRGDRGRGGMRPAPGR
ncbi:MAG: CAP domain-containing protein, partial [Planctomycetota bacterium]|nr:CAP domain-containing protein [Planctomycetota bacterium]